MCKAYVFRSFVASPRLSVRGWKGESVVSVAIFWSCVVRDLTIGVYFECLFVGKPNVCAPRCETNGIVSRLHVCLHVNVAYAHVPPITRLPVGARDHMLLRHASEHPPHNCQTTTSPPSHLESKIKAPS